MMYFEVLENWDKKKLNKNKKNYNCGYCQNEDADCNDCIRSTENKDKENNDLEDLYFYISNTVVTDCKIKSQFSLGGKK